MFFERLYTLCQEAKTILLTGPQSLDGDSIGACLALHDMIAQFSAAQIDVSGIPTHQYVHLEGLHSWKPDANLRPQYDLAIVVDGDCFRLAPTVEQAFNTATHTVLIDHHKSTDTQTYALAWLEPTAVSTCSMIYTLLEAWNCTLTPKIAEAIYVGLLFDTGGFQHSNTNPETLRLAAHLMEQGFDANRTYIKVVKEKRPQGWKLQSAMFQNSILHANGQVHIAWIPHTTMEELGCDGGDLEGLVNDLRCTAGVDFAALIVGLDEHNHKVSLRSNPSFGEHTGIDCSALAQTLSTRGGGHVRASGARLTMSLTESIDHVTRISLQFVQSTIEGG
mgnify:CR=1 FL=1